MNEAIYQLAAIGRTIRLVIQKKPDGDFILGISNGKDAALICQGTKETVDTEFESALPDYLGKLKAAAIEARLNAVDAPKEEMEPEEPDYDDEEDDTTVTVQTTGTPTATTPVAAASKDEQPELNFGF